MKNAKCKNIENNCIFDYIHVLGDFAIFRLKNYCGKILTNGKISFIIAAEDINYLDGNFWAVKKHGKWGVVHHNELTKAYSSLLFFIIHTLTSPNLFVPLFPGPKIPLEREIIEDFNNSCSSFEK